VYLAIPEPAKLWFIVVDGLEKRLSGKAGPR
jgi:hypothetical protein